MRSILIIDAPDEQPVSLEVAKLHLRVDGGDEDTLIQTYIDAVTATLDGPDGWLGRALVTQTLELRTGHFGCEVRLPCGPVNSVVSVNYVDPVGAVQTLDPATYRLSQGYCVLQYGKSWPAVRQERECVRLQYVAGYGAAQDVPKPIIAAMLLMIGDLYMNREAQLISNGIVVVDNPTVINLLTPYRVF